MQTRKHLHPFWLKWFISLFIWPIVLGFTVEISGSLEWRWYDSAALAYTIILGAVVVVTLIVGLATETPFLYERPLTEAEKARQDLDQEFPGGK